jgi:hypothetical protein
LKAAIRNAEVEKAKAEARCQFHQHFWRQSRTAFAHIIFDALNGKQNLAKKHKLMATCQNLKPKVFIEISAHLWRNIN